MATFAKRVLGAARLDPATYEDVEADSGSTGQAMAVVLLASVAGGVGSLGLGVQGPRSMFVGAIASLVAWIAWATLTSVIGTRWLPAAQTHANVGELLRTLGFAAAPGLMRVFGVVPLVGGVLYVGASLWMLAATVVAVRQALDYTSTARAVAVCVVGWLLSLAIAAMIGTLFATRVS